MSDFDNFFTGIMSVAASAGNSRRSVRAAKRNTDATIQANKDMAKYQYEKNLEQWYRENEYNSPDQQMRRLRNAGLNPNLVYGNGSVSGNTTTSGPRYQAPDIEYNYEPFQMQADGIMKAIDFVNNQKLKDAQAAETMARVENLATQRDALRAKTENEIINRIYYQYRGSNAALKYKLGNELFKTQVDYSREQLSRLRGEISLQDYRKKSLNSQMRLNEARREGLIQDNSSYQKYGFTRNNAPWWLRMLINGIDKGFFDSPSSAAERDRQRHIVGYDANGNPIY